MLVMPPLSLSAEQARGFSGHSGRHFLPTVARLLGIPKEDRDELGRWLAALDANGDGEGADEALLKYALLPRVTLVEPPGRRTRRRDSLRQMRCVLTG